MILPHEPVLTTSQAARKNTCVCAVVRVSLEVTAKFEGAFVGSATVWDGAVITDSEERVSEELTGWRLGTKLTMMKKLGERGVCLGISS